MSLSGDLSEWRAAEQLAGELKADMMSLPLGITAKDCPPHVIAKVEGLMVLMRCLTGDPDGFYTTFKLDGPEETE